MQAARAPAPAAAAPRPVLPPPVLLHLPPVARPTHYEAELTIDPSQEDFSGTITIDLLFPQNTDTLWLNAEEITLDAVTLSLGSENLPAVPQYPKGDFVALLFPRAVGPGPGRLLVKYHGKAHRGDGDGIYMVKEGDDWYAFTQFEAIDARQAFPCFDEPGYKVPWRLAIRTRKDLVALSNTPIESETPDGQDGKLVRFAETPPLPSYLIAFAVGPFDFVNAGKTRHGVPIRIVVPRNRGKDAAYAAEATRPILDLIEDDLRIPYPYQKLDLVAVPVFNHGAMENPGLVTFHRDLLLTKPREMTRAVQRRFASVAAHELAHMWFGNLVTMAWWDDVWLNESFASWMNQKIVARWRPKWGELTERARSNSSVMRQDGLDSARMIRQPVESTNDIMNAFDGITYAKGAAVLTMMESHVGAAAFGKGVRAYLDKHKQGNATYDDFVGAVADATGVPVRGPFDAFVRQSGVPLVSMELLCKKGTPPRLALTQERYAPLGSKIDRKRTWQVPVCVRYGKGNGTGKSARACTVLSEATGTMNLPDAQAGVCPDWVLPNDAGVGYYRAKLEGDGLARLLSRGRAALTVPERISLIGDVNALVASGAIDKGKALAMVAPMAGDPDRYVVEASMGIVDGVDEMIPAALRPAYEGFLRKTYGARARSLGWRSRSGDSDDVKELRPTVLALVAGDGKDKALIAGAKALAWKWLGDPKAVEPEMERTVLWVAARYGDRKLFDRLHADARKTQDRHERGRLLSALASFTDPALVQEALKIALSDEFEARESMVLVFAAFGDPLTRPAAYEFLKTSFDAFVARLPMNYRAHSAETLVSLCDEGRKAEIEATFAPRVAKLEGGPRLMDQVLEQITVCAANRQAQAPSVTAFFKVRR